LIEGTGGLGFHIQDLEVALIPCCIFLEKEEEMEEREREREREEYYTVTL